MKIDRNCFVDFFGCIWDAQWEFDCPAVVFWPIQRYTPNAHSIPDGVLSLIDDICCDLSAGDQIVEEFHASDLKEFSWRGWSPKRFAMRKSAFQIRARISFERSRNGFGFRWLSILVKEPGKAAWKPRLLEST